MGELITWTPRIYESAALVCTQRARVSAPICSWNNHPSPPPCKLHSTCKNGYFPTFWGAGGSQQWKFNQVDEQATFTQNNSQSQASTERSIDRLTVPGSSCCLNTGLHTGSQQGIQNKITCHSVHGNAWDHPSGADTLLWPL